MPAAGNNLTFVLFVAQKNVSHESTNNSEKGPLDV